jgi:ABC-type nitrate/sulfonate/bicarbonate transport system substrate-binding protein
MSPAAPSRRGLLLTAAALAVAGGSALLLRGATPPGNPRRIMVAEAPAVASALFYVARDQGYFEAAGIAIETITANSGREALDHVARGEAELAMSAEAPFVRAVAAGVPARIVATIETSERNTGLIVPDASPIRTVSDIKGRRIGYCPGTSSEYFLAVFLQANGLHDSDIVRVAVTPKDAHAELAAGRVDALCGWQEIRARADQALGHRTRIFYAEGFYLETWNLVGLRDYLDANPDLLQGFLRALLRAQSFIAAEPEAAVTITAASIGIDRATIAEMWPDYAFDVGLDDALIANLEGHWRLATKPEAAQALPDFMADLAPAPLQAVDPGRVTYLR